MLPLLLAFAILAHASKQSKIARNPNIAKLKSPLGYTIEELATLPKGGRSIVIAMDNQPGCVVFTGGFSMNPFNWSRTDVPVHATVLDAEWKAVSSRVVFQGMHPNGVEYYDGVLYIAEPYAMYRCAAPLNAVREGKPLECKLWFRIPGDNGKFVPHQWKYIRKHPDRMELFITLGAPCNKCATNLPGHDFPWDSIVSVDMTQDNPTMVPYGVGIRKSVGLEFHPISKELWFTDNGADWMGDDIPDCELNRAKGPGSHFGYPFCHCGGVGDPHRRNPGESWLVADYDTFPNALTMDAKVGVMVSFLLVLCSCCAAIYHCVCCGRVRRKVKEAAMERRTEMRYKYDIPATEADAAYGYRSADLALACNRRLVLPALLIVIFVTALYSASIRTSWQGNCSSDFQQCVQPLGPHTAPLGLHFYRGTRFEKLSSTVLIAEHGSWNRGHMRGAGVLLNSFAGRNVSSMVDYAGYRVAALKVSADGSVSEHFLLLEGFLNPDGTGGIFDSQNGFWGRPVDVAELPDGSLLVSFDYDDGFRTGIFGDGGLLRLF